MAKPRPSWRQIEAVLLELLRAEGISFAEIHGETYIALHDAHTNHIHEICIGDFAKQLEERL